MQGGRSLAASCPHVVPAARLAGSPGAHTHLHGVARSPWPPSTPDLASSELRSHDGHRARRSSPLPGGRRPGASCLPHDRSRRAQAAPVPGRRPPGGARAVPGAPNCRGRPAHAARGFRAPHRCARAAAGGPSGAGRGAGARPPHGAGRVGDGPLRESAARAAARAATIVGRRPGQPSNTHPCSPRLQECCTDCQTACYTFCWQVQLRGQACEAATVCR